MKNTTYFYSVLAILPFLMAGFFFKANNVELIKDNTIEAIDSEDRLNHEFVLTVLLKLKKGNEFDVTLPEEFQVTIPKEYNHLVLNDNNLFYDEEYESDIDYEALEKVTNIKEVLKNLGDQYKGKNIVSAEYFVFNRNSVRCFLKWEFFVIYLQKCWGVYQGNGPVAFPVNCFSANRCSCLNRGNIDQFPCNYCWMEPEFSNRCVTIALN